MASHQCGNTMALEEKMLLEDLLTLLQRRGRGTKCRIPKENAKASLPAPTRHGHATEQRGAVRVEGSPGFLNKSKPEQSHPLSREPPAAL